MDIYEATTGDLKQGSVLLCLVVHVLARVHIHSFIIIIYYNNILSSSFTHTFFVVYKHNIMMVL